VTSPVTLGPGLTNFTDLTLGFHANLRKGMTVVRILGTIRVNSTDASLSTDFAMGITTARGSASFPDPSGDAQEPWLYWFRGSALPASDSGQHRELDVQSQRLFRDQDRRLIFLMENDDSTQSLEWTLGLRILYKLP